MSTTDALPVPVYNTAYRVYFEMRLSTGALCTGGTGMAAKVSRDGTSPGTSTNTPTEIPSSTGVYYLDLTATEMQSSCTVIIVTSTTATSVPAVLVLYLHQPGQADIPCDVSTIAGSTTAATNQAAAAATIISASVDTGTYTATVADFETSLTVNHARDFYKGRSVIFTGAGALALQATRILGSNYTVNNKHKLTVGQMTASPTSGQTFIIV